jgi:hypothetical protein
VVSARNVHREVLPALPRFPAAIGWFAGRPLLRLAENSFGH